MRCIALLILICTFSIFIQPKSTFSAGCLNNEILSHFDSDSADFLAASFPSCVYAKDCKTALLQLEKLNKKDPVLYSFIKGCALANGDCLKRDVGKAFDKLLFCSKYSYTCKMNLLRLYYFFEKEKLKYKEFALELANENDSDAYAYLIDAERYSNPPNRKQEYFWLSVYKKWILDKIDRVNNAASRLSPSEREKINDIINYEKRNLQEFLMKLNNEINTIQVNEFGTINFNEIDKNASDFFNKVKNTPAKIDPLSRLQVLYSVDGESKAKGNPFFSTRVKDGLLRTIKDIDIFLQSLRD